MQDQQQLLSHSTQPATPAVHLIMLTAGKTGFMFWLEKDINTIVNNFSKNKYRVIRQH